MNEMKDRYFRIEELVTDLFDDKISEDLRAKSIAELSELMIDEPEAQEYYVELMTLQAMLETELEPLPNTLSQLVTLKQDSKITRLRAAFRNPWQGSIVLAVLLLLIVTPLTVFFAFSERLPFTQDQVTPIPSDPLLPDDSTARLTATFQTRWDDTNHRLGDKLKAGDRLTLLSGQCEITFARHAKLICEAPACFVIDGDNGITLREGKVVVTAPPSAFGFSVKTKDTVITDFGTEFGVSVATDRAVGVQVFVGDVIVEGEAFQTNKKMGAGEAFAFESNGDFSRQSLDSFNFNRNMPEGTSTLRGEIIVYSAEEGLEGNQYDFPGALGHDFDVVAPIEVTRLGVFDSESNGLFRNLKVELWQRDDAGTPSDPCDDRGVSRLIELDFTPDNSGSLVGGFRFKPLASPLELPVGSYTIVASGFGEKEPNFNTQGKTLLPAETAGAIVLVGTSRYGNEADKFPTILDGALHPIPKLNSTPNQYAAASFSFRYVSKSSNNIPLP